jgi:hypothetical protein
MRKFLAGGHGLCLLILILVMSVVFAAPIRGAVNTWRFGIQKTDDVTSYQTLKRVEDTCRAMTASYNADKLTYEQYRDDASAEKKSWGEQAKMRANKTASSYNNYVLRNRFVWRDGVPGDIEVELGYLR